MTRWPLKRASLLLLCILLLALLTLACQGGGDDTVKATPTAIPMAPAGKTGMQAINGLDAAGVKPDCDKYPIWLGCSPAGQSVPVKELP